MSESQATVFIVDDDEAVRDSAAGLVDTMGLRPRTFDTAQEFLNAYDPAQPGCLLLDVRLPGMSGLRLQDELIARQASVPVIFISGHGDLPMAVEAMKKGAYDFLEKPVGDQILLDRINAAVAEDLRRRALRADAAAFQRKLDALTSRERDVLQLLKVGRPTGAIARTLRISPKTVQVHRTRILEKLGVDTLTALIAVLHRYEAATEPALPT